MQFHHCLMRILTILDKAFNYWYSTWSGEKLSILSWMEYIKITRPKSHRQIKKANLFWLVRIRNRKIHPRLSQYHCIPLHSKCADSQSETHHLQSSKLLKISWRFQPRVSSTYKIKDEHQMYSFLPSYQQTFCSTEQPNWSTSVLVLITGEFQEPRCGETLSGFVQ